MKCYLCQSTHIGYREGKVRDRSDIKVCECQECGLVFLEDFEHIGETFYEDDKMHQTNAEVPEMFNTDSAEDTRRRFALHHKTLANKSILDFGCGKGDFLHQLKREGLSSRLCALEPNRRFHADLSGNFTLYSDIDEIEDGSLEVITMFHVLEHLKDPAAILDKLHAKLVHGGKLIIEVPSANDALLTLYRSPEFMNFTYWSCHLFLFNRHTLEKLIGKTDFQVEYIKSYQRYSLANHLHWLSKGKPGGHILWSFLDDELLNQAYASKLASLDLSDTLVVQIGRV